MKDKMG